MRVPVAGSCATIAVKMISDMPLPMPRCVMSSPSHMMNAVPAVSVRIISARIASESSGISPAACCGVMPKSWPDWISTIRPVDCRTASTTVT